MSTIEAKTDDNKNDVNNVKEHLGLIVVAHVDAGKSTTTARLIYELGEVNEREMNEIQKKKQLKKVMNHLVKHG